MSRSRAHLDKLPAELTGSVRSSVAAEYGRFARERPALVYAQCWRHARRMSLETKALETAALALIDALREIEAFGP